MVFSKSITFDDEGLGGVAAAAPTVNAFETAESTFIENLRQGDGEAFDLLVTRYANDVYSLLFRLTSDTEEAHDLTQETFLSALKAIKSFRGDAGLKTWLFRIAINHSRNRFRWWSRRRKGSTVSLDEKHDNGTATIGERLEAETTDPEMTVIGREREQKLFDALHRLPEMFREAVVLCDVEGHSYDEIAIMLEVSLGTVKSRISRGRELLRQQLTDI